MTNFSLSSYDWDIIFVTNAKQTTFNLKDELINLWDWKCTVKVFDCTRKFRSKFSFPLNINKLKFIPATSDSAKDSALIFIKSDLKIA